MLTKWTEKSFLPEVCRTAALGEATDTEVASSSTLNAETPTCWTSGKRYIADRTAEGNQPASLRYVHTVLGDPGKQMPQRIYCRAGLLFKGRQPVPLMKREASSLDSSLSADLTAGMRSAICVDESRLFSDIRTVTPQISAPARVCCVSGDTCCSTCVLDKRAFLLETGGEQGSEFSARAERYG